MNYLVLKILTLMTMKRLNCSSGPWVFFFIDELLFSGLRLLLFWLCYDRSC